MVIPKKITHKVFASKVISFILDELSYLREKFEHGDEQLIARPDDQKYIPFYQCIGKAATLFAVMYKDKVKLTLYQNRRRFAQSARVMDDFVNHFSNSFFQRVEAMPGPWFPVMVLTYCGVFGAIADCCKVANRPDLVEVCMINLELDMRTIVEDIKDHGGWRGLYDTSSVFAALYDTKFWNDESDQEQAQEPAEQQAQEPAQELAEQQAREPAEQQAQEPAQELAEQQAQEPAEQQAQEPAQELAEQQAQEPAQEKAQEPVQEAREPAQELPKETAQEACAQEEARETEQES